MASQPFTGVNQQPLVFAQIRNGSTAAEENPAKVCIAPEKLKISEGDFLKLFYLGNSNKYCHEYDKDRKFQVIDYNKHGKNIVQAATKYYQGRLLVEDIITLSGKVWKFKPTIRVADFFANSLGVPIDCWTACSRMEISRELENADVLKYELTSCDEDKEVCAMTAGELHEALNGFPSHSVNDKEVQLSILFENENPDIQPLDLRLTFILVDGLCPVSNDPFCGYTYDPQSGKCFMWCYSETEDNIKQVQEMPKEHISDEATSQKIMPEKAICNAIGPSWTTGDMEPPAGEKDMGGWTAAVYTEEQQIRLNIDEFGQPIRTPLEPDMFVVMNNGKLDYVKSKVDFKVTRMTKDGPPPSIITLSYDNCSVSYRISKLKNKQAGYRYNNYTYVPNVNEEKGEVMAHWLRYSEGGIVTLDYRECRVTITGGGDSGEPYRLSVERKLIKEGFVVMNNVGLDHIHSNFEISAVGKTRDFPPSTIIVSYGGCSVDYTISRLKNGTPGYYYQNNTYLPNVDVEKGEKVIDLLRYSESGMVTEDFRPCRVTITGGGNSTQPYRISYEGADILKQ